MKIERKESKVYEFLKEFFKPNKWKVILTFILMVLIFIFLLVGIEWVKILFYFPIVISSPFNRYTSGGFDTVIVQTSFSTLIGLLIYITQLYVISCLIIVIFKKISRYVIQNAKNQ